MLRLSWPQVYDCEKITDDKSEGNSLRMFDSAASFLSDFSVLLTFGFRQVYSWKDVERCQPVIGVIKLYSRFELCHMIQMIVANHWDYRHFVVECRFSGMGGIVVPQFVGVCFNFFKEVGWCRHDVSWNDCLI